MTAKNLYEAFNDIFPNLASECGRYKRLAPNVIELKTSGERRKGTYTFSFRSERDWTLSFLAR